MSPRDAKTVLESKIAEVIREFEAEHTQLQVDSLQIRRTDSWGALLPVGVVLQVEATVLVR